MRHNYKFWNAVPLFLIGLASFCIGALFTLSDADRSVASLAKTFPPTVQFIWLAFLLVGGLATMIGIVKNRTRWEGAGLFLIGTAYIVDVIAILSDRGIAGFLSGGLILSSGIAIWIRALVYYWKDDPVEKAQIIRDLHEDNTSIR